jgi:hypothetical protein
MLRQCSRCGVPREEDQYLDAHGHADLKTCKACRDRKNGANKCRTNARLDKRRGKGIVRVRASANPHHDAEEIMGGSRRSLELLRVRL